MKAFIAALAVTSVLAFKDYDTPEVAPFKSQAIDIDGLGPQKNGSPFSVIDIEVDGVTNVYYVAAAFDTPGESEYVVPSNGRGYISTTPTLDYENPEYFKPNLLGGSVEWDVDLSNHECGCIAAFYLVSMPGKNSDGDLWMDTDGWGYCDANQVAGNWCPEFDLMEANKWAWATTPHKCDAPSDKGFY